MIVICMDSKLQDVDTRRKHLFESRVLYTWKSTMLTFLAYNLLGQTIAGAWVICGMGNWEECEETSAQTSRSLRDERNQADVDRSSL